MTDPSDIRMHRALIDAEFEAMRKRLTDAMLDLRDDDTAEALSEVIQFMDKSLLPPTPQELLDHAISEDPDAEKLAKHIVQMAIDAHFVEFNVQSHAQAVERFVRPGPLDPIERAPVMLSANDDSVRNKLLLEEMNAEESILLSQTIYDAISGSSSSFTNPKSTMEAVDAIKEVFDSGHAESALEIQQVYTSGLAHLQERPHLTEGHDAQWLARHEHAYNDLPWEDVERIGQIVGQAINAHLDSRIDTMNRELFERDDIKRA